ncbi:sarcosine oxidase subunit gamma [Salinisphaera aquimarina]|uniref:Sarcosine oxidase subunit gamma n=1 Tax=Salinisphaera aquimarina TaxID=2094031 RepID=A0ABV7ETG7_9GAMM
MNNRADYRCDEQPAAAITLLQGTARTRHALANALARTQAPAVGETAALGSSTLFCLQPNAWWIVGNGDPHRDGDALLAEAIARGSSLDISPGQRILRLRGAGVVERLSQACALDLRLRTFGVGRCTRCRLADVAVVMHRVEEHTFDLYCPRSYGDYLATVLMPLPAPDKTRLCSATGRHG